MMYFRFTKISIVAFILILSSFCSVVFGDTLEWSRPDVYKPSPVLFLHGFALGNSSSWNSVIDGKYDGKGNFDGIAEYFKKYATLIIDKDDLSRSFLERVNFNDPNGSIDTYDSRKFNPNGNSQGWADKVKIKMDGVLSKYRFKNTVLKVNIICHSMGGLAAREYITNPKYSCDSSKIDKLITIGTPHVGSPLGNIKKEVIGGINKYIIEYPPLAKVTCKASLSTNSSFVDLWLGDNKIDINGEAIKDMAYGSNFLHILNYQRSQPSGIKKYAICGWSDVPLINHIFYQPFYSEKTNYDLKKLSDLIVPYDSQRGYDIITNYPQENWVWKPDNILEVNADHMHELENPNTVNYILKLLDSTPPEFTLDSPIANSTTEINTNSISIKGKVYKEYLPADSKIVITGVKQEDGSKLNEFNSDLKPSGLWIPNNPDSPVAEFNETIAFPGEGTYKISCQIKNPAGLTSAIKAFWVKVSKVIVQPNANIIVHCHNPEGKEIASIQDVGQQRVKIYDGDVLIGSGAYDVNTHRKPISIPSGKHAIKAKFNGMTMDQNIDIVGGTTRELTFVFTRTTLDVGSLISHTYIHHSEHTCTGAYPWVALPIVQDEESYLNVLAYLRDGQRAEYYLDTNFNITPSSMDITIAWGMHLSDGGEYGGFIYESRIQPHYTVNYIPRSDFEYWYLQRNKPTVPSVYFMITDEKRQCGGTLSASRAGCVFGIFDARIHYKAVWVYTSVRVYEHLNLGSSHQHGPLDVSQSKTASCSFELSDVSSVPYDMLGTAV